MKETQTKGIINENYKPLIAMPSHCPNSTIQDVCITPQVDHDVISSSTNLVIPTHTSDPAIATPNIGSFVIPGTPQPFHSNSIVSSSFSSKLDSHESKLYGKIMAMKPFFIYELHTIKNES